MFHAWLTALLLTPIVPQEAPVSPKVVRQPLVGRVSRTDGTAWQGAHVELRSLPLSEVWCSKDIDVVEATTDRRGKFEALLVPGRNYFAWAWDWVTPQGDRGFGTYRITHVAGNVCARRPVVLSESRELRVVYRVPVTGAGAWKSIGGVRAMLWGTVASDAPGASFRHAVTLELRSDDTVQLPVWPSESASLVLFTRRGGSLGQKTVDFTHRYAQKIAGDKGQSDLARALADRTRRVVSQPYPLLIKVVDWKAGTPVAGAELFVRWREQHFPFGRTDRDGECRVYFPSKGKPNATKRLQVGVGGYGMGVSLQSVDVSAARAIDVELEEADWVLPVARRTLRGRILLPDGRPAARAQVLIGIERQNGTELKADFANSLIDADANGRFVLHEVAASARYRVCVLLRPEHTAALDPEGRAHVVPLVVLASGQIPDVTAKKRDRDLGTIDLDSLSRTTITVTNSNGRVARNPTIVLTPGDTSEFEPLTIAGNGRGTATFLHARDFRFAIAAAWKHGFATGELKAWATRRKREVRLTGRSARRIEGTVVDPRGHPVAGAEVRLVFAGVGVADVKSAHGKLLNRVDRTGSGGGYSLTVPVPGCEYRLSAKAWIDGRLLTAVATSPPGKSVFDPLLRLDTNATRGKRP